MPINRLSITNPIKESMLAYAKAEVQNLRTGEEFKVSDFFQ